MTGRSRVAYHLMKRYGMTPDDYNTMLDLQNGVCAICKQPETHKIKGIITRLAVDHDHKTGAVRALLCHACNGALGLIDDNIETLKKMVDYLS